MTSTSKTNALQPWIQAARLRTLPLALAVIFLGSGCAYFSDHDSFSWSLFFLALSTSLFYQVLSNYANDLGDGVRGTDDEKQGEQRAIASGAISVDAMRRAVNAFTFLALISGASLSFLAFSNPITMWVFQVLNLAAIWSARSYTLGSNPYAYWGGGDFFVFIFFGFVGVGGSYALYTETFDFWVLMPSAVSGMMSAAVLTLNNLRDQVGDAKHGKTTLVVRYGHKWGRGYFKVLVGLSTLINLLFALRISIIGQQYYTLIVHFLFLFELRRLYKQFIAVEQLEGYDGLLKPTALLTLGYCTLTALSLLF